LQVKNLHISQLIIRCKKADKSAQFELYKRYYKAMYNTAFRILNNSFEAEDIMQESFLNAYTKLGAFKADYKDDNIGVKFGAWLKRIIINKSLTHLKKMNKYDLVPLENVKEISSIEDEKDYSKFKVKALINAMQLLKENYKVVLTLHFIEGYDYQEIAQITNTTYQNVRVQVFRAKKKLKENLKFNYEQIAPK